MAGASTKAICDTGIKQYDENTSMTKIGMALLLSGAALLPGAAFAADASGRQDTVTPDRPGFTNGSDTVAGGRAQVEIGLTRMQSAGEPRVTDGPEALLRTGLNARTELRLTLPNQVWQSHGGSGFSDGAVGVRYKVFQSRNGAAKLALTPTLTIPVRSAVTSSGHADPSLNLSGQIASGSRWGLSSNLILGFPTQNGRRVADYTAAGQVVYGLSQKLSVFGDVYEDVPVGSAPSPLADTGLTYLVQPRIQLDLETGLGLGGAAPAQFYGGGVAFLF